MCLLNVIVSLQVCPFPLPNNLLVKVLNAACCSSRALNLFSFYVDICCNPLFVALSFLDVIIKMRSSDARASKGVLTPFLVS